MHINLDALQGLEISYDGKVQKTHKYSEGLHIDDDGKIRLPPAKIDGGLNGGVFGKQFYDVALYINTRNQLVVEGSGGGGGVLLVVPMGAYFSGIAVFPTQK